VRVIVESTSGKLAHDVCHALAAALKKLSAKASIVLESGALEPIKSDYGTFAKVRAEFFSTCLGAPEGNYTVTGHTFHAPAKS
jgi:hypothetical protein